MGTNSEGEWIATPPPSVCQNCGNKIFRRYPLGAVFWHVGTPGEDKERCPAKRHWKKPYKKKPQKLS